MSLQSQNLTWTIENSILVGTDANGARKLYVLEDVQNKMSQLQTRKAKLVASYDDAIADQQFLVDKFTELS